MMQVFVVALCAFGVSNAAVAFFSASGDKCVYEGKTLRLGEQFKPAGECIQVNCDHGQIGVFSPYGSVFSCPPAPTTPDEDPQFVVVERKGLLYPDCCPTLVPKDQTDNRL